MSSGPEAFDPAARLRLRPYALDDEMPAREANAIMEADGWRLLLDWDQTTEWRSWLKTIDEHRRGLSLSVGLVPSVQLVADVDGVIVGSVRVRFSLNKGLERSGGHIGYGVVPAYRRRGYATEMLRQALIIARSHGIQRVLVTCLDDNVGSARVIEKCGGVLDEIIDIDEGNLRLRRYSFA